MGLNRPDVLLVGGLFGVVGYILWWALANLPMIGDVGATNPIALSIVVNGMLVRYIFGKKGAFGKVPKGVNRWVASERWRLAALAELTPAAAGLRSGRWPGCFLERSSIPCPRWRLVRLCRSQPGLPAPGQQGSRLAPPRTRCRAGHCARCSRWCNGQHLVGRSIRYLRHLPG